MRRAINLVLLGLAISMAGCQTMQAAPEPTADLSTILNLLRDEIAASQEASPNRPANLSIKSATVVLKVTAGKSTQAGGGVDIAPVPVKLSFTRTTTGTLENTITLELANPCTQDLTDSAKDGKSSKLSCAGNMNSQNVFKPGPGVLSVR